MVGDVHSSDLQVLCSFDRLTKPDHVPFQLPPVTINDAERNRYPLSFGIYCPLEIPLIFSLCKEDQP